MKLDQGKFCDAIQKLNDFKARVQQLSAAAKLSAREAEQLTNDANAASTCVLSVATSAGVPCAG